MTKTNRLRPSGWVLVAYQSKVISHSYIYFVCLMWKLGDQSIRVECLFIFFRFYLDSSLSAWNKNRRFYLFLEWLYRHKLNKIFTHINLINSSLISFFLYFFLLCYTLPWWLNIKLLLSLLLLLFSCYKTKRSENFLETYNKSYTDSINSRADNVLLL